MVLGVGLCFVKYTPRVAIVPFMSKLCRACGLDLSTCKRYEHCLLSRQANVLSVLSLLLEEQVICHSCLGAYRMHIAKPDSCLS